MTPFDCNGFPTERVVHSHKLLNVQTGSQSEGITTAVQADRRPYSNEVLIALNPDSKTCLIQQTKRTQWHDVRKALFCANYRHSGIWSYRELPYAGYTLQDYKTDCVPDFALLTLATKLFLDCSKDVLAQIILWGCIKVVFYTLKSALFWSRKY